MIPPPATTTAPTFRKKLLEEKLLVVGCGSRSIRFRPHLVINAEEIQQILDIIRKVASQKFP